jgi:hypothetical protein
MGSRSTLPREDDLNLREFLSVPYLLEAEAVETEPGQWLLRTRRKHIAGPRQGRSFPAETILVFCSVIPRCLASAQPLKVRPMAGTIPTQGTKTHDRGQVSAIFYRRP